MKLVNAAIVGILALFAAPEAEAACPFGPQYAQTTEGCVRGTADARGRAWLGIPFAAPPVGALRWRAPAPAGAWVGIRPAQRLAPACPQRTDTAPRPQSEDCLYLNVWAPPTAEAGFDLPVMVFIHGGGLWEGDSGRALFDGRRLAVAQKVMVVSFNYRLGQLGFLAHPELSAENTKRLSGNYGFLDQVAALRWVKENIKAFGGDPTRVTLFGESAGAGSMAAHLASPLSANLFQAAIAQSGPSQRQQRALRSPTTAMPESAEAQGIRYARELGCPARGAPACMRAKPVDQILKTLPATNGMGGGEVYLLTIDGFALTDHPTRMIMSRNFNGVPLVAGINGNEASIFTKETKVPDAQAFAKLVRRAFRSSAERVLQLYPLTRYESPKAAYDAIFSDFNYVCPTRRLARAYSQVEARAWLYRFTWVTPFGRESGLGAHHAAELEFILGNFNRPNPPPASELSLSANLMARWGLVARGIAPGADWPAYNEASDRHLVLDIPMRAQVGLSTAACDFFDTIDVVP